MALRTDFALCACAQATFRESGMPRLVMRLITAQAIRVDFPVPIALHAVVATTRRLSKEWGSSAEQAMTGRTFQRLGNGDEVGFALGRNRD